MTLSALLAKTPQTQKKLVCMSTNCGCTGHLIKNCYWKRGGKEGQFPLNFGHQRNTTPAQTAPKAETPTANLATTAAPPGQTTYTLMANPQCAPAAWLGNFNRHHLMWDNERNRHLFTRANLAVSEVLIDMVTRHGMVMMLACGTLMLEAKQTKDLTRPNNVFVSDQLRQDIIQCEVKQSHQHAGTDHSPIITILHAKAEAAREEKGQPEL